MQIRIACPNDLGQIVAIYNQAVSEGNCTADITPLAVAHRKEWFAGHTPDNYPIYVMEEREDQEKIITGWYSLSAHRRKRMALQNVAEISYYVDKDHRRKGVGGQLMEHALQEAPKLGLPNLFTILLDTNQTSIAMLKKNGFSKWGYLPDIAEFPDKICGQFIYGRKV
ncbi:MAG: GNAT family N-acetyltransferase [Desulfocapsa sp.]|nr:GNAT family N-acetyltransferase [Desulfocapsa sp.]